MYCSKCGAQIPQTANFCPKCGQAAQQPNPVQQPVTVKVPPAAPASAQSKQTPPKKKPGCFARLLKGVGIFFAVILVIGLLGSSNDDDKPASTSTVTARPAATATATKAPTATPKPTETPEPETEADKQALVALAKTAIEEITKENFTYYNVSGDETGFTVSVAFDGLVYDISMIQLQGKDVEAEGWRDIKTSALEAYRAIRSLLDTIGLQDAVLMLNLLNDVNNDNILLSVFEGQIVYDCLAAE